MNVDTGAIYYGDAAIQAAKDRGEPIAEVSEQVARLMEAGRKAIKNAAIPTLTPSLSLSSFSSVEERLSALEKKLADSNEADTSKGRLKELGFVFPGESQ